MRFLLILLGLLPGIAGAAILNIGGNFRIQTPTEQLTLAIRGSTIQLNSKSGLCPGEINFDGDRKVYIVVRCNEFDQRWVYFSMTIEQLSSLKGGQTVTLKDSEAGLIRPYRAIITRLN